MKRKTAKEILAESFRELAEKKDIDKITVKDITSNCGYSPATFYRQFSDKYDLIAWDYFKKAELIITNVGNNNYPWIQAQKDALKYYEENKDYLKNLFLHTSGLESFIHYMAEINQANVSSYILNKFKLEKLDKKTELCLRLYCYSTAQLICEWILGKHKLKLDELVDIFDISMPVLLKKYLF